MIKTSATDLEGASFLANTLNEIYGTTAAKIAIPDGWETYRGYMREAWKLTPRQLEAAMFCIKGKTNIEIAALMGISIETVNVFLDQIYQRAGVSRRGEIAAKLLEIAATAGFNQATGA